MAKKAEERHDPDRYRVFPRPAVKNKFQGAVVRDADAEHTPIVTCGHVTHTTQKEATDCIRTVVARRFPSFNIVN